MTMLMTTTPDLPGAAIQPIGIVFVQEKSSFGGNIKLEDGLKELEKKAAQMGAQAVVGIQFAATPWGNNVVTSLMGTAVKFVQPR